MKVESTLDELWKVKDQLAEESDNEPKKFVENLKRWEADNLKLLPDTQSAQSSG